MGEITESFVHEKLNLPIKAPRDINSGFYILQAKDTGKFDSVRISLYQDDLSEIDSNNSLLINFAVEIFNKSIC